MISVRFRGSKESNDDNNSCVFNYNLVYLGVNQTLYSERFKQDLPCKTVNVTGLKYGEGIIFPVNNLFLDP
jgi:hypothetical protein